MRLKSYFAGTVESAICLARQEMGEEAMLVSSRKTPPEAKHLGMYEVVFASAQEPSREAGAGTRQARSDEAPSSPSAPARPSLTGQESVVARQGAGQINIANEIADIRRQIVKMSTLVSRSALRGTRRTSAVADPALDDTDQLLQAQDVDGNISCSILRNLEVAGLAKHDQVRQALRRDIESRLKVSAELSPWSPASDAGSDAIASRRIVALVGPPGVGKTLMVAKLAVRFGLSLRRTVHLISYDNYRIASGEQLRSYAAILGVGFEAIETVGALAQSLKEHSRKDLVLVDTPGFSARDFDLSWELTKFLSTYPHVDVHLVLSCGVKSSDISRMVDRYNIFGPAKLMFTRVDETDSYGVILNESVRTGLPVSFLGTGPHVPDDLEPATKDRIIDLLLEGRESCAVAMA